MSKPDEVSAGDRDGGNVSDVQQAPQSAPDEARRVTTLSLLASAAAAAFGVQSRRNRERDFGDGRVLPFIIAGVLFTALFAGAVIAVVNIVLASSGASD